MEQTFFVRIPVTQRETLKTGQSFRRQFHQPTEFRIQVQFHGHLAVNQHLYQHLHTGMICQFLACSQGLLFHVASHFSVKPLYNHAHRWGATVLFLLARSAPVPPRSRFRKFSVIDFWTSWNNSNKSRWFFVGVRFVLNILFQFADPEECSQWMSLSLF